MYIIIQNNVIAMPLAITNSKQNKLNPIAYSHPLLPKKPINNAGENNIHPIIKIPIILFIIIYNCLKST